MGFAFFRAADFLTEKTVELLEIGGGDFEQAKAGCRLVSQKV